MITTSNFPNFVTSAPENIYIKRNSLTKEDLEGAIKKDITSYSQSKNGGICQNIEI